MKIEFFVLAALLAVAEIKGQSITKRDFSSANLNTEDFGPSDDDIPQYLYKLNPQSGSYTFAFNTLDLKRYEEGFIINKGSDDEILIVRGKYIYKVYDKEGRSTIRKISYTADENGFQPHAGGLPQIQTQPSPVHFFPRPLPKPYAPPVTSSPPINYKTLCSIYGMCG